MSVKPGGKLTSRDLGSEGSEVKSITLAKPGSYPDEHEDEGEEWKAGFDKAALKGNTVKACVVFANNYSGGDMSDAEIEAEIERLTAMQDARS